MKRRKFIAGLGSAAAWPLAARAQLSAMPVVGLLYNAAPSEMVRITNVEPFRAGLAETGFTEGQNIAIDYRWTGGRPELLPTLAGELVRRQVAVIATMPNSPAALAAKAATLSIPVVFLTGADPVAVGIVPSLARPGGNITGFTVLASELAAKRVELLHELVPAASSIAFLFNPNNPNNESKEVLDATRQLGLRAVLLTARHLNDLDVAFTKIVDERAGALVLAADSLFDDNPDRVIAFAARHSVPTLYARPESVVVGGLMSYGPRRQDHARQVGVYVGRILKGERPSDLPVQRAVKIGMTINLRTAKTLGLNVPQSILLRADEVIE
jgi:putative tryptophan/tyrosine transport system substrate-binding protein